MKPITDEIIQELDKRGISLDQYRKDTVVKSLLDADFEHDFVLKSIDDGDITSFGKSKYTVAEETRYDEKKSGEHERRDYEEGKRAGEKEEKEKIEDDEDDDEEELKKNKKKKRDGDMEKSMQADFFKSQQEFFADFRDFMSDMQETMKSMQDDLQTMKNQPAPFRTVDRGAILEKSMGVKTNDVGSKVLSKSQHREAVKRVLTECFEKAEKDDLKKSLGEDLVSYSIGGGSLSSQTVACLKSAGIELVD